MTQAKSHGRVEHARQGLVNAEEKYLRAHGWELVLVADTWLWAGIGVPWGAGIANVLMTRSEAVQFQHRAERLNKAAKSAKEDT